MDYLGKMIGCQRPSVHAVESVRFMTSPLGPFNCPDGEEKTQSVVTSISQAQRAGDRGREGQPVRAERPAVAIVAGPRSPPAELNRPRTACPRRVLVGVRFHRRDLDLG